jgi:hypothetical protein
MKLDGSGYIDPSFLTLALALGEWSASRLCSFTPGEKARYTHWLGGWVGPNNGVDGMQKWKFSFLAILD